MKMLHDNALRRRKQTVTAVALVIHLRPRRQMHGYLSDIGHPAQCVRA